MAEDSERRMERLVFGVSPPTMTASSAGPTFGVQGNLASIDWHGIGPKKASLSGTSAGPPRPAVSTSTAAASGSSSHRLLCRPWDCGDLLRRLGTFKLSSWNQKPQVIGPAVCARKGWVNVDVDVIACEGCDTHLSFAVPQLSQLEAETAAQSFREQLEAGHKASCPWKGNACAESLAQFPTSPVIALIGGYNDRCDALLQLPVLPFVSAFAIDQMKLSRGPQIDRMLSQPPAIPVFNIRDSMGAESSCNAFYKTQRIISLCGWEARLLPHAADFEDHSAQSTRNTCSVGPSKASHKRGKRSSMLYTRVEKEEESKGPRRSKLAAADPRYSAASALLECNYCGANVNVSCFRSITRPASGGAPFAEYLESEKKVHTLVRGASAASSVEGWYTIERRNRLEQPGEGGEGGEGCEATTSEEKANGPLHLTFVPPPSLRPSVAEQPEGSEMGDCGVASYESRGPRDDQQGTGQGDSSIYMPQFRAAPSESGGGTNGDHEGDEVDNGDVEGKSYAAESSKHKRMADSLAADQHSLGMAVSGSATAEGDTDAEVGNDHKNKRICIGPSAASASDRFPIIERPTSVEAHGNSRSKNKKGLTALRENLRGMRRLTGEFPCSSSVNATDTCFQNKRENSMDSVEFMPQDDAQQNTAASGYTENEWLFDEPNSVAQAQQSTSYAPGYVQRGTAGDKSGDEDTNAAVISTGTATAGGGSVGMVGIGAVSRRVQSNEADIQGGYGADFSEHQTESVAGEAEVVIDAVEHQGHSGELGLVCDSAPLAVTQDGNDDSHDAMLSLCQGVGQSAKDLGDDSGESGSRASLRPRNGFPEEERTADTTNAVIVGGSLGTVTKEGTDGSMEVAVGDDERAVGNSAPALGTTAKEPADTHIDERQLGDFDPIRRHRSFCPWVNGLVLAAANGTFGTSAAVCGWQLTVDALDAFHMQENIAAGVTESESTASMCKSEEMVLKQGSSSPKQCNGSSAYWDPK